MKTRFGKFLSELTPLSDHDVDEILEEQKLTQQLFGDTAIALGLVQPQHVWRALIEQASRRRVTVDLEQVGIDSQAITLVTVRFVHEFHAIPVRAVDEYLVLAIEPHDELTAKQLPEYIGERKTVVVTTRAGQASKAISRYFPAPSAIEAA